MGYKIAQNKLVQDNKSAIPLGGKWKIIQFQTDQAHQDSDFFVIYRVSKGELEIEHCHIERIWYNLFTKPILRTAFREFRAEL